MSKRNRNKKRKEKIQKKAQQYFASEKNLDFEEKNTTDTKDEEKIKDTVSVSTIDLSAKKLISRDIKMILITLFVLALILAGVKILQNQTDLIDKLGDWLIKILNIRTS